MLQDVLARYKPGRGRLRVCIITDGEDCREFAAILFRGGILNVRERMHICLAVSPAAYQGVGGLNPMMRTLKAAGYDVEWFIIVLVR